MPPIPSSFVTCVNAAIHGQKPLDVFTSKKGTLLFVIRGVMVDEGLKYLSCVVGSRCIIIHPGWASACKSLSNQLLSPKTVCCTHGRCADNKQRNRTRTHNISGLPERFPRAAHLLGGPFHFSFVGGRRRLRAYFMRPIEGIDDVNSHRSQKVLHRNTAFGDRGYNHSSDVAVWLLNIQASA